MPIRPLGSSPCRANIKRLAFIVCRRLRQGTDRPNSRWQHCPDMDGCAARENVQPNNHRLTFLASRALRRNGSVTSPAGRQLDLVRVATGACHFGRSGRNSSARISSCRELRPMWKRRFFSVTRPRATNLPRESISHQARRAPASHRPRAERDSGGGLAARQVGLLVVEGSDELGHRSTRRHSSDGQYSSCDRCGHRRDGRIRSCFATSSRA